MRRRLSSVRQKLDATFGGLPRVFWTLWWGLVVNRMATFVAPLLAVYLVRDRGLAPDAAGRVVALYGLGMIVAGPLGGLLADRLGRRPTLVAGLASAALAVGGLAVATAPAALAALAFAASAGGEIYRPAVNAAIADLVPGPERARAWGLVYWGVNLGMAVGLLLAGLVATRSLTALFLADAATSLAFGAVIALRVPETRPAIVVHEPALAGLVRVFRDGPYAVFLVLYLLSLAVFIQWQLGLPLDMQAHGLGPSAFSFLMGLNCAGVVVLQPLLARRLARVDRSRLLAAMALLFGVGYGVNALELGLAGYALGTACWTVGEVVGFPAAAALVADLAPVELRGRYQGAFSMSWGVAFTLSPLLAGELLARAGARVLWLACLGIGAAVAAGYLATGAARRRRVEALQLAAPDAPRATG